VSGNEIRSRDMRTVMMESTRTKKKKKCTITHQVPKEIVNISYYFSIIFNFISKMITSSFNRREVNRETLSIALPEVFYWYKISHMANDFKFYKSRITTPIIQDRTIAIWGEQSQPLNGKITRIVRESWWSFEYFSEISSWPELIKIELT
jgi:hypothetical protein